MCPETPSPISHISDTARWVAYYRAMESDRPDAHFRDPYARRLSGASGEEIVRKMRRGRSFAWPMIVRTALMDEIIQREVTTGGVDVVMNLASGLDTRAYRMALPAALRWFDVDLPGMLDYKRAQLANERPVCALEYVAADLTDAAARRALFARVGAAGRRVLVVTEGLLVYLTPAQVTSLARDLHAVPTYQRWLIDLASPLLLQWMARTWGKQLAAGGAPMVFGPAEGTAFFEPLGWRELEYRSMWEESFRLKRTLSFGWLWRLLGRLSSAKRRAEVARMSGIVLFERI
ncbi:MAG TPA: class I SAM-dependent methyltransferase [Gemmatimonadales bacterium]